MLKLIKPELIKNKLNTYLLASVCIFIFGLGFCFLFGFAPQLESQVDGVLPPNIKMSMFNDWNHFISLISILFTMSFGILSAVMHTKFTVEEYTGKRAVLLFSYPQSRRKILFAKCSLVFCFTTCFSFISNIIAIGIFAFFSNIFQILPEQFGASLLPTLLSVSGVCSLLAASVGLVAMRVGFWKKSLVATVVTSVLLVAPFSNLMSLFPQNSSSIRLIGMGVLLAIGLLVFIELMLKVNKMEAA